VGQGTQIGRVGNSGTEEYHLHCTQLQDGKAVRIAFNGSLIDTHAGQSPYSPWGNGEKLTSLLGSAGWTKSWTTFSPFTAAGKGLYLAYTTGTGKVDVDKLNAAGTGVAPVWSAWWTPGWA
jgi:hypothetical protein